MALEAAQALILSADVANDLRGEFALRVEALGLFLKMDTLKIESTDAGGGFGVGFSRDPTECFVSLAVREEDPRIVVRDAGDQADHVGQVGRFGGTTKAEST